MNIHQATARQAARIPTWHPRHAGVSRDETCSFEFHDSVKSNAYHTGRGQGNEG